MGAGAGSFLFSGLEMKAKSLRYDLRKIKIDDNYVRRVNFKKNYIKDQVNWDSFLSKHDLIWERTPNDYFTAPFRKWSSWSDVLL